MRALAGILLAAALLLGISGLVECFPGLNERAWKWEIQRLSADGRPSEILSHVQTNFLRARESRIETATECFLMAALLFYLGWVAITRAEARRLQSLPAGPILLPAKPRLLHLRRLSTALFGRRDRIQGARVRLQPKLETLFERHTVNDDS